MKHVCKHLQMGPLMLGALWLAFGLVSCSKDDDKTGPQAAGLMAFNLSPDKPLIGIALSGNAMGVPLAYTNYTGGYLAIYPGQRSTEAYNADDGQTFATASHTYTPGKYYSLFVTGADGMYQNLIVDDGLDSLSGQPGRSYIRYVDAVVDSAAAQVTVEDADTMAISESSNFGDIAAFVPVKSGDVTIGIHNGQTLTAERTISLEERKVYTVLLLGKPPDDSLQIRYVENGTLTLDSADAQAKFAQ